MNKTKILVIEDKKNLAKEIQKRLNCMGYEVTLILDSGEDVSQLVENAHPDVVLIDIMLMGEVDGIQAADWIRTFSDIPVIYLADNLDESTLKRAKTTQSSGFVVKPFKESELAVTIETALCKYKIEQRLRVSKAKCTELSDLLPQSISEIDRPYRLLEGVSEIAQILLGMKYTDDALPRILPILGKIFGISRAYIFENEQGENGELLTSQRFEWGGSGIDAQIDNPVLQRFSYESVGYSRWISKLSNCKAIYGIVDQFPLTEQALLAQQDILSIIVIPIFVCAEWWGFIRLDDCSTKRGWTPEEVEALWTVSNIIGMTINYRRTEKVLQESMNQIERIKKEWEATIDSLPQIVCLFDTQGHIIRANRAIETWDLAQVVDVKGRGLHELFHPDCSDSGCLLAAFWHRAWNEVIEGRSSEYEATDGILKRHISIQVRPIQNRPRGTKLKTVSFAVAIVDDTTEYVRAEEEIIRAKEEWERTFNAVQDLIMVIDRNWRITRVNKAMADRLGRTQDECRGLLCYECINGVDEPPAFCPHSEMLANGNQRSFEISSEVFGSHLSVIISPLYDINGKLEGSVHYARDVTETTKAEEELQNSREQLRSLAAHLQSIREEERKHIAREIHDELGQALTVLKMDLHWFEKQLLKDQKSMRKRAKAMLQLIDGTIKVIQRISTELRPGLLDDLGLVSAIEWQVDEFRKRTGIKCDVTLEPIGTEITGDLAIAVFRTCQESLTNVIRHADASNVKISLSEVDGMLELRVSDDGKGIKEEQITDSNSLGLIGMRERVRSWGGEIKVTGVPDHGTTIMITIPLNQDQGGTEK